MHIFETPTDSEILAAIKDNLITHKLFHGNVQYMQTKNERIVISVERYLLNRKGRSLFQDEHNSMWHSKQSVLLAETTFFPESKFFNIIFHYWQLVTLQNIRAYKT